MDLKSILKGAKLIRNYRTSYRPRKNDEGKMARIWLEKPTLGAANFNAGDAIIFKAHDDYIHIRAALVIEMPTHKLHTRKGKPLLDLCNEEVHRVLGINIKIDIIAKEKELFIYKEQSFDMVPAIGEPSFSGHDLKKFRVMSLFCGGGGMTSAFINTQACESVFAVDIDEPENNPYDYDAKGRMPSYMAWSVETFRKNFPKTLFYWGDVRSVHTMYVPRCDIVIVSPPCVEYSKLGRRFQGIFEHFTFHIARLILASGAMSVFFENVPSYFKSESYAKLKGMLEPVFPDWHEKELDSYDLGSINCRKRAYTVAFREDSSFSFPEPIKIPESKRKTVADYIQEIENREWKSTEEGTMAYYLSEERNQKYAHTNFTMDKRELFLVKPDAKRVACFTKSYSIQPHQSYLKHPKDNTKWDRFTPDEIMGMLEYPSWFKLPEEMSNSRKHELLGNSVNCLSIEAIASNMVAALMQLKIKMRLPKKVSKKTDKSCTSAPIYEQLTMPI